MCQFVETLCWDNDYFRNLPYHEARFNATRRECLGAHGALPLQPLLQTLTLGKGKWKVRLVYDRNGVQELTAQLYTMRSIASLQVVCCDTIAYDYKSTDRQIFTKLLAQRNACDEILILRQGLVTDTSYTNVAFFDGYAWFTPRTPLLCGTMRAALLAQGLLHERAIGYCDWHNYQRIMLFNAMIGWEECVLPVTNIRPIV